MQKYYTHKINNLLIIKKIVTIHYQEIENDYSFNGEVHNFWEIAFVDKNSVTYEIDNKKIDVKEKDIVFIKPNTFHSLSCSKSTNIFIISFDCYSPSMSFFENKVLSLEKEDISLLSNIINEAKKTFVLPTFDPELNKLELVENPPLGGEQLIKNYLEIFLIDVLRKEINKSSVNNLFVLKSKTNTNLEEQIIMYLKNNIYNKITLDDVCKETMYCKTFVCTHFKKAMNISIINYYTNLKIEEAKKLIKGNRTFNEIAYLLNFDTPSHFTNTFKKVCGMTPKQYKSRILK